MVDAIDLRDYPDQVASMEQYIFAALKACSDEEPINFDVEATIYADYIGVKLILPRSRFNPSETPVPTKFKITRMCYCELNDFLRSDKFYTSNRVLVTIPCVHISISVTYNN